MISSLLHPIDFAVFLPVVFELVFGAVQEVTNLDVTAFVLLVG